jgi:hypothetical protein
MLFQQLLDRAVVDELLDDQVELRLWRGVTLLDADTDTARTQNVAAQTRTDQFELVEISRLLGGEQ